MIVFHACNRKSFQTTMFDCVVSTEQKDEPEKSSTDGNNQVKSARHHVFHVAVNHILMLQRTTFTCRTVVLICMFVFVRKILFIKPEIRIMMN